MRKIHTQMRRAMLLATTILLATGIGTSQDKLKIPDDPFAAVGELPIQKSVSDGIAIRVIDAAGRPMAGVSLLVLDFKKAMASQTRMRQLQAELIKKHPGQIEMMLVMTTFYSTRYVTDSKGEATVRPDENQTRVLAVHKRSVAHAEIDTGAKTAEIKFPITDPVHVLVVDERGEPVSGVLVGFSGEGGNRRFARAQTSSVTDDSGRAAVSRRLFLTEPRRESTKMQVVVWIVSDKVIGVPVDLRKFRNSREKPLRLTLPACGSVEVQVLGTDNRPHRKIDYVRLGPVSSSAPFFGRGGPAQVAAKAAAGSATFKFVQTGMELVATVSIDGRFRPERKEFDGPQKSGEKRVVRMANVSVPSVIDVRLVGLDGKPVVDESVGVIFLSSRNYDHKELVTDSDGRLRIRIPDRLSDAGEAELRIQRVRLAKSSKTWHRTPAEAYLGAYRATLKAVRKLTEGSDLELQSPILVLSGRLVDEEGRGVAGVVLTIPPNYPSVGSGGGSGNDLYFHPRVVTDADGRFAFHELSDPRKWVDVQVQSDTHMTSAKLRFETGTRDVAIRMTRTFKIFGKVLGVPDATYSNLIVQAERQDEQDQSGRQHPQASMEKGGAFTIKGCLPGTYRIVFKEGRSNRVCHTIDNVKVIKGSDCRDHRLLALDLSLYIRSVRITVVDERGRPVPGCTVRRVFERKTGRSSNGRPTDRSGSVTFMMPAEGGLIEVNHAGYRFQRFEKVRRDLRIKLGKSYKARVTIENLPTLKLAYLEVNVRNNYKPQTVQRAGELDEFEIRSDGRQVLTLTATPRGRARGSDRFGMRPGSGGSRSGKERLLLRTVEFDLGGTDSSGGPVAVKIKLTPAQVEFLRNYDALLGERRK